MAYTKGQLVILENTFNQNVTIIIINSADLVNSEQQQKENRNKKGYNKI